MENIDKLAEQLSGMQEAMISLQKDRNVDDKKTIHKQGTIIMVLGALLAAVSIVFIGLMSWTNTEHQRALLDSATQHEANLKDFLSEYDFETITVEQNDNEQGTNNTSISK